MFKKNRHGTMCRCEMCKNKRKTSLWYMGGLLAFLVIMVYQTLLLLIFTTRLNAFILIFEMLFVIIGFFLIIF